MSPEPRLSLTEIDRPQAYITSQMINDSLDEWREPRHKWKDIEQKPRRSSNS